MAGKLAKCKACRVMLGLMTLLFVATLLGMAGVWNPLPTFAVWWANFNSIARPSPAWTIRVGGVAEGAAVMATGHVVVASKGAVDGYDRAGVRVWHARVAWALPARDVVVVRPRPEDPDVDPAPDRGFDVLDPATGTPLWADDKAAAVWAFSDAIVDLHCPDRGICTLRGREHRGAQLWSVALPGDLRTMIGPAPPLAGVRDPAEKFADALAGSPGRMPAVVALGVGDRLQVVDTVAGTRLREVTPPDRLTRIGVAGDKLLYSVAQRAPSGCRYAVDARSAATGDVVWHADGLDLDTASGAGCEQRRDPLGAAGALVVVRGDNRPALVEVSDGRQSWTGEAGEALLASDGELAVVRRGATVNVVDLLAPDHTVVYSVEFGGVPEAVVTRDYVLLRDPHAGRLVVVSHLSGAVLAELKTKARVIGLGPGGVVLASGRRIGFVAVNG